MTFDGTHFDYQGTCKFRLASVCNATTLERFDVFARNEYRFGQTSVSWPLYVEIFESIEQTTVRLTRNTSLTTVPPVTVTVRQNVSDKASYSLFFSTRLRKHRIFLSPHPIIGTSASATAVKPLSDARSRSAAYM